MTFPRFLAPISLVVTLFAVGCGPAVDPPVSGSCANGSQVAFHRQDPYSATLMCGGVVAATVVCSTEPYRPWVFLSPGPNDTRQPVVSDGAGDGYLWNQGENGTTKYTTGCYAGDPRVGLRAAQR